MKIIAVLCVIALCIWIYARLTKKKVERETESVFQHYMRMEEFKLKSKQRHANLKFQLDLNQAVHDMERDYIHHVYRYGHNAFWFPLSRAPRNAIVYDRSTCEYLDVQFNELVYDQFVEKTGFIRDKWEDGQVVIADENEGKHKVLTKPRI